MTPAVTHPNALDLEALAVGEETSQTLAHTRHVEACVACRAYVARARGLTARVSVAPWLTEARRTEKRRRVTMLVVAAAPLAAAAAFLLVARGPSAPAPSATPVAPSTAAGASTATRILLAQNEPDTTFKGGPQVAIVRERTGAQDRFVGTVRVRPGDRLRVEVALDRSQAILAGVRGDDGSWVELMPEAVRGAGTHFSEKSARIDATPSGGTIFVGAPEAVRRARETGDTARDASVRALRVEWEAK